MAEWWESAPLVAPASASTGSRRMTVGVEKPPEPKEPPSGYRWTNGPDSELVPITGGPADKDKQPGTADAKMAEQKAAFLAGNLFIATNELAGAIKRDPNAAAPTWSQWAAGFGGKTAAGAANTPERRQVEAAQRGILDSALTLGTGAAYTKEQLEGYREQYFPTVTDDEATVAAKGRMLRGLLMNARVAAGSAAPKIDETLAALGLSSDPLDGTAAGGAARISDAEATAGMQERIRRGDKPTDIIAWLNSVGRPPTDDDIKAIAGAAGNPRTVVAPVDGGGGGGGGLPDWLQPPEIVGQLDDSIGNVLTGIAKGAAALPDLAAKTVGTIAAVPVDALGYTEAANRLRNPLHIGDLIERSNPTPEGALNWVNRQGGELVGGVLGLPARATGAIVDRVAGALPKGVLSATPLAGGGATAQEAAERIGVRTLPADVGGPTLKALTSGATQAPLSRGPVVRAARQGQEELGNAASRASTMAGRAVPEDEAGEAVRKGGVQYIRQITDRASRWYDKANEWAENIKIMPPNAIAVLDRHIAAKKEAGEIAAPMVEELEKVRRTLDQAGGITVTGMREARSLLGAMARNDKLRGTDAGRIFGEVLEAASGDMTNALVAAGKGRAASMFTKADRLWRERIGTVDEVLEPIIGKTKSGEDIIRAVEGMARGSRGGVRRLERVMATLPREEKGNVTATIIDRIGRARPSAQDDTGSIFSSETFLTNWNSMSHKGKKALFGSGEVRKNLDDIAKVAAAKRETNALASKSNTPIGIATNLGVIGGVAYAHPVVALLGGVAQVAGGRLLASRRFTRWLAATPSSPVAAVRHVAKLDRVARADPVIANDIMALKDFYAQPITARAAASEPAEGEQ
jgi:hypothetical protein